MEKIISTFGNSFWIAIVVATALVALFFGMFIWNKFHPED
jgi:hypothetical protein